MRHSRTKKTGRFGLVMDPEDLAGTISEMLERGEIVPRDVPRCVFWSDARATPGCHEAALAELDRAP